MGSQLLNSADAAYPAMSRFFSQNWDTLERAYEDYYVLSGGAITAGTSAGTLKLAAGYDFFSTTELSISLQDNIACTSNADATNPKFAILEVDNTGTGQLNVGTAAANPVPPTLTASRVPHALIYIPANAAAVDALLATANGNAKIIDWRVIRSGKVRNLNTDVTGKTLTNPTSLTSLLNSTISIPANSLRAGDQLILEFGYRYTNSQNASTHQIKTFMGSSAVLDYTTVSLASNATGRGCSLRQVFSIIALGATGTARITSSLLIAGPGANMAVVSTGDSAASAGGAILDTTGALDFDIHVKVTTSSSSMTFVQQSLALIKHPI